MDAWDAIVVGGGAAGLYAAIIAGQLGKRVLLIEHNEQVGKKILISGGGRCNFTNLGATAANYLGERPEFAKSALARHTPWDFLALIERHGIAYHEKKLGQQFCDGSSRQIVQMLLCEAEAACVEIRCATTVREVSVRADGHFHLLTQHGSVSAPALVIATGGLSFPKLGATDFGHRIARQFGHRITPLRPALVPLTLPLAALGLENLSGVAYNVEARAGNATFPEAILFTHRGISGPAILQISSFWREGQHITLDLLPHPAAQRALATARSTGRDLASVLAEWMPRRLAETWAARHGHPKPLVHYKQREFEEMTTRLRAWHLHPSGTEGYPKAEVTLGGVDTAELSSKTMESRRIPGLYFIGEVVDITGWLGGYNFQWAWASAHAAGTALATRI